jgi:hypothetical protein
VKFTKNPSEVEIEKIGEYLRETVHLVKETLAADWCFAYSYVVWTLSYRSSSHPLSFPEHLGWNCPEAEVDKLSVQESKRR